MPVVSGRLIDTNLSSVKVLTKIKNCLTLFSIFHTFHVANNEKEAISFREQMRKVNVNVRYQHLKWSCSGTACIEKGFFWKSLSLLHCYELNSIPLQKSKSS